MSAEAEPLRAGGSTRVRRRHPDLTDAGERRLSLRASDAAFDAVFNWHGGGVEGVDFELEDTDSADQAVIVSKDGALRYSVECEVIVTVRELPPNLTERELEPVVNTRVFRAGADLAPPPDVTAVLDRDGSEWTRDPATPQWWRCSGGVRTSWAGVLMWSPLTEVVDASAAVTS